MDSSDLIGNNRQDTNALTTIEMIKATFKVEKCIT